MEIVLDNKSVKIFKELYNNKRTIQETAESVVPDTDEDIGKIAAIETNILLKSKDISARGVLVTGEAIANLMYITESQDRVSFVKLSKQFSIEYEITDISDETVAQINLCINSAEARIINPRKVSVCFEICGELSCYAPESLTAESGFSPEEYPGLHAKYETSNINTVTAVCEKSFSINEQFSFPSGKPRPTRIISCKTEFVINDSQLVGTKVIVKGSAITNVYYLSDEVNYPVKAEFVTSFSQIVDIGEEMMENCVVTAALTGTYFDLSDSISGDKLLDIELHVLLQLVCRSNREVVYISDAYSNLMQAENKREKCAVNAVIDSRKIKVSTDERLNIMDDCADVLSIFLAVSRVWQEQNKLKAVLAIDVVYRTNSGLLSSAHRSIDMETEYSSEDYRIYNTRLTDVYFRPDGQYLDGHFSLEINCLVLATTEIDKIVSITLNEESPIALSSFPTVTLVRCSGETMWELAKNYHSNVEAIKALNDTETELNGRMLLIPKSI